MGNPDGVSDFYQITYPPPVALGVIYRKRLHRLKATLFPPVLLRVILRKHLQPLLLSGFSPYTAI